MTTRLLWRALCLLALLTVSPFSSATNHPDPSAPEQGVTFSHVYKIDIPGSSGCKLESLPTQDETGLQRETATNGENDIIFRHNIRLQTPKCDCEESESFKSLLYRVNGLEEEVNYLKTQCTQGCCGGGGGTGVDTSCSGHGTYQHDTCSCLCNPGWEGPDCSVSSCPDECNDNGRCVDGKCVCHQGYTGDDCSQLMCPGDCNDKGHCVDGKCVCFPHFTGEDCSIQKCPNDCIGNGRCVDGQCVCDEGFYGEDCSLVLGPQGLRLVQATDVSLLVEWESVRGAEYYILTYQPKDDNSALQQVQVPNTENSYLITGLSPGVTYIVQVYAVIKKIQSEADKIEATTDVSAINDIRVLGQTEVSIQVDWKNPPVELDHFRLRHTDPAGQEEELNVQMSQEARTKHTIVGLFPGTEYQISVQGIKGTTEGKSSSVTGATDIDAPTNLITTEITEDTATVAWNPVQAGVDGYMLSYTSAEGSSAEIPVGRDSTSYRLIGLRPGVLHTVYIWAFKGDKVSRKSSTEAETELDAPTNFLAQDETESSFRVSWDHTQAEIDGYTLTYSSSEGSSGEIPVGSDSSSYMLDGLKPGVLYTVYIWAIKGSKASKKISTQAETELDAPANLLAREETESSFSVSWDQVQADIDGYTLTYSSSEGSSEEIPVGSGSSSYMLTGLKPGVLYTVYIWAIKGSKASKKISTQAETELDAPANLSARDVTESSFSVSWDPALAEIDGYILTYSSSEGSSGEIPVGPESTSYMLTSLKPGVLYTVYIWAIKGSKSSKKISTQAETELDAPANLLAREETESSFSVSWDQVQADIDGYTLTYSSSEGSSEEIPVGSDSSSYMLTGLKPGVLYTVYIWAIKGSKASKKISTQAETELDAPANLLAREETESSFSVSWDQVQADIDGYTLTYSSSEGSSEEIPVGSGSSSYMLTGLKPGVLYTVYIWAIKGSKASKKISTQAETELDAPANLSARDVTESSFNVSWDPALAEIDSYILTYSSSEGSSGEISMGAESTSYMLTNLRPGVLYTVYIWAIKGSKFSKKISTQAETELDAPANLLARDETESSFSVSWDHTQAEIDGYVLTYSSSEGSSGEIPVGSDSSSYTLTGLKPGVLYTVYIWAIKGSKASKKISTEAETELDAPANLLAREETESSFSVSWDQVQADIDGYTLTYSSSEGSSEKIPVGSGSSSYMLTGLKPGVLYTVYIWAIKGSKASKKISTQAETELDAPANLLARDETESSFRVSWDPVQADIDGYVLTYSSSEGSSEEIPVASDSTSYMLTGLRPGVLYTVYIWAIKGSKATRKISTRAETDIDAPKDLKATDVTLDAAVLNWIAPLADIEGYILTYRDEDGNMKTVEKQLGASESSLSLSSLEMGKRYIVTIIAYRGNKRSKVTQTIFKTVGLLYPFPMDCFQMMKNGFKKSGIYTVYINNDRSKPIEVYCDMETDGGGWLVLQRRNIGKLDFFKRWRQYIAGFGNMTEEFWIGLDKIYELTNTPTQYDLRFDLGLGSERVYAVYDNFKIAPVKQKFKLTIGKYSGNAGDAMTYHQGRPWTTIDSDNDIALSNCALAHRGAWWYKNCHLANLNGKWGDNRHSVGVNWKPWKGHLTSLDFTEMKIRPVGALSSRKRRSLMARQKSRTTDLHKK
ncbi:tenascin-N isoform X2 [Larimichthys crocea]|uniref:tenascin-N isoform X2 n=1 Tax=Larimichthys crocea TaxID=215358 RepID=UPI000F5F825A|nr:tenascin-N isoform X2 [Larimichthys crocea]